MMRSNAAGRHQTWWTRAARAALAACWRWKSRTATGCNCCKQCADEYFQAGYEFAASPQTFAERLSRDA